MKRKDASHFSHVLAAVQRTGSLPGGAIRGLPNGNNIDGLQGIHTFALQIADSQKEFQLGRVRSALEQIKQLEVHFDCIANRWNSSISSLISDIRQGKQLKNLEKLKELKAGQIRMQQLVSSAPKAFQDLVSALDHDAIAKGREPADENCESAPRNQGTQWFSVEEPNVTPAHSRQTASSDNWKPEASVLGRYAFNYQCGPKLQLTRDAEKKVGVVPKLEHGKFYFLAGLEPPRVIRIRELQPRGILVYDTHRLQETTPTTNEFADLIRKGVWVLVHDD